jgi:hypothetical protein
MSPRPVFLAALLLSGAATFWVAWAVGTVFGLPQFVRIYMNEHQGDGSPAVVAGSYLLLAGAVTLVALLFLLVAVSMGRGSRAARVVTWVLGVPAVAVAFLAMTGGGFEDTPWWGALTRLTGGLSFLTLVAGLVLLCLPASRAHFRRPAPPPPPVPDPLLGGPAAASAGP